MKELLMYREKLIERLVSAAKTFRAACLAVKDPLCCRWMQEAGMFIRLRHIRVMWINWFMVCAPAVRLWRITLNFKTSTEKLYGGAL